MVLSLKASSWKFLSVYLLLLSDLQPSIRSKFKEASLFVAAQSLQSLPAEELSPA